MLEFSVLMSVYYKENPSNLITSLDSIINQTLKPSEIILVIDGALTDELDKVIDDFKTKISYLRTIRLERNTGLGAALNEGLKHCNCEFIARMDSDDISKPTRFEKQISIFKKYPELDVVGAWIDEFYTNKDNIISTRKLPENPNDIYIYGKNRCPLNHPVIMFRKKSVLDVGGYMQFPLFEDYYLWVRMLVNNAKFYNIQESLLWFRFTPDTFKRRGGLSHAYNEIKLEYIFYKIGYINIIELLKNCFIRFTVRIIPNNFRQFIYTKLLR